MPDFAPSDHSDGRNKGEWESRYSILAKTEIDWERSYLFCHLIIFSLLILGLVTGLVRLFFGIDEKIYDDVTRYIFAWLGGALAGTINDVKWLYHVVAKEEWNIDRRLWRIFQPYISGSIALCILILTYSGIINIFNQTVLQTPLASLGIGIIAGFSADNASAKILEMTEIMFGKSAYEKEKNKHQDKSPPSPLNP